MPPKYLTEKKFVDFMDTSMPVKIEQALHKALEDRRDLSVTDLAAIRKIVEDVCEPIQTQVKANAVELIALKTSIAGMAPQLDDMSQILPTVNAVQLEVKQQSTTLKEIPDMISAVESGSPSVKRKLEDDSETPYRFLCPVRTLAIFESFPKWLLIE